MQKLLDRLQVLVGAVINRFLDTTDNPLDEARLLKMQVEEAITQATARRKVQVVEIAELEQQQASLLDQREVWQRRISDPAYAYAADELATCEQSLADLQSRLDKRRARREELEDALQDLKARQRRLEDIIRDMEDADATTEALQSEDRASDLDSELQAWQQEFRAALDVEETRQEIKDRN